jgi:predicted nuclease of restriction endonuclease-like RecB superfamily
MLSPSLLAYGIRDGLILPHYLTARDEPWVRLLIDSLDALVGRTQGDAARTLNETALEIASTHGVPIAAVRAVRHLLERRWRTRPAAGIPSREIRRVVFELGKDPTTPRDTVLQRAANVLGLKAEQVSEGLFADSSSERRLSAPPDEPSARAIIDAHNVALVQEFLLRSEQVVVHAGAHAAPILRVAKQRGLMYTVTLSPRGATITLPGPASLFQQNVRYGRALAALFPAIASVPNWSLEAKCLMGAKMARFHAFASDPVTVTAFDEADNAVERRLVDDFRRLGSRFTIAPATEPPQLRGTTFFPDFTFESGGDRVFVEIIGFHTSAYLKAKLDALRSEGLTSVLLCVDDALACSEISLPDERSLFHFQRRIEVGHLQRTIETLIAAGDPAPDSDQRSR